MIAKSLADITEADIEQLKTACIQEGRTIEYKQELPGTKDEEKREFLADASSFANTDGGDIIYGVAEEQGVITNITGVDRTDFDAEILRLESLIRDGIAPRIRSSTRVVSCAAGKLLVLRLDRSWNGPHRVVFRGHDKFYARTSTGKFPLDVSQLRTAFFQGATVSEQMNGFRLDRLVDIANDRLPVLLVNKSKVAIHIIPLGAFLDQAQHDLAELAEDSSLHQLWEVGGRNTRMTFDGVLSYGFSENDGRTNSYAHFYRNGILESAHSGASGNAAGPRSTADTAREI